MIPAPKVPPSVLKPPVKTSSNGYYPCGRVLGHFGRWPDKGIVGIGASRSRLWWVDVRNVLHCIDTPQAFEKWFKEPFWGNLRDSSLFTTAQDHQTYCQWLMRLPIGAKIDIATGPLDSVNKPWSYQGKPSGGSILHGSLIGSTGYWWLKGYYACWIAKATVAEKYWPKIWKAPPPGGIACYDIPGKNTVQSYWIGLNIDH